MQAGAKGYARSGARHALRLLARAADRLKKLYLVLQWHPPHWRRMRTVTERRRDAWRARWKGAGGGYVAASAQHKTYQRGEDDGGKLHSETMNSE
jgi:hypothetical protein